MTALLRTENKTLQSLIVLLEDSYVKCLDPMLQVLCLAVHSPLWVSWFGMVEPRPAEFMQVLQANLSTAELAQLVFQAGRYERSSDEFKRRYNESLNMGPIVFVRYDGPSVL